MEEFERATAAFMAKRRYSATGLPAGMAIEPETGVISGVPTESGRFSVTVTCTGEGALEALTRVHLADEAGVAPGHTHAPPTAV